MNKMLLNDGDLNYGRWYNMTTSPYFFCQKILNIKVLGVDGVTAQNKIKKDV